MRQTDRRSGGQAVGVITAMVAILSFGVAQPTRAQVLASEHGILTQTIAGTTITIDYYRPSVRGRDSVFGRQVTWGEIWTPGANRATTISTNRPIRIDGHLIAPGRYAVWFQVLRDSAWTFALHPDTGHWHVPPPRWNTMSLTFPMTMQCSDQSRETLTWEFDRIRATGAVLRFHWDHTVIPLEIGIESNLRAEVDDATGRRYAGTWLATPTFGDSTRRRTDTVQINYDAAAHRLTASQPDPTEPGHTWQFLLMPRSGDGVFLAATMLGGELAQTGNAGEEIFIEFETQNSRGVRYAIRDAQDHVWYRGVRADAARR